MKIDHYIVHFTTTDPTPDSMYGAGAPHDSIAGAFADCRSKLSAGRKAFITSRNKAGEILEVIPIAWHPVAGATSPYLIGEEVRDYRTIPAVDAFLDSMDWSI